MSIRKALSLSRKQYGIQYKHSGLLAQVFELLPSSVGRVLVFEEHKSGFIR